MSTRDIIIALALNFLVAGAAALFKGPNVGLICLGIGFGLLTVAFLFFYNRGLIIHYAGHGIGDDQYADVTNLLRGFIRNNRLNVPINGATFPDDPYPGKRKHVWVRYSYRSGAIKEKTRHDGDRLILP